MESGNIPSVESDSMLEDEEVLYNMENMSIIELEQYLKLDNYSESGDEAMNDMDLESAYDSRSMSEESGTGIRYDAEEEKV